MAIAEYRESQADGGRYLQCFIILIKFKEHAQALQNVASHCFAGVFKVVGLNKISNRPKFNLETTQVPSSKFPP